MLCDYSINDTHHRKKEMPPKKKSAVPVAPSAVVHQAVPVAPSAVVHQAVPVASPAVAVHAAGLQQIMDYFGIKGILSAIIVFIISFYLKQYLESGDPRDACIANASSRSFLLYNVSVVMHEPYVPDSIMEGELPSISGHVGKEYLVKW